MNIFSEMLHSLYDFKCYPDFVKRSGKSTFLYGTVLALVYFFVVTVLPAGALVVRHGGFQPFMEACIPDFILHDGRLWVEKRVENASLEGTGGYLLIDTEEPVTEHYSKTDLLAFDSVLIADAENIVVKGNGQMLSTSFADLGLPDITRSDIIQLLGPMVCVFVGGYAVAIFASIWLETLIIALLGNLVAALMRKRQRFGAMMKLAVHALTVVILIEAVYAWVPAVIPFVIPFAWLISYGLPLLYIWKGLRYVGTEQPVNHWGERGDE